MKVLITVEIEVSGLNLEMIERTRRMQQEIAPWGDEYVGVRVKDPRSQDLTLFPGIIRTVNLP